MALHSEQGKPIEVPVSISIDEMLKSVSLESAKPYISKVPSYLRQVNEKAYEPLVISIGPYHHGKDHLKAMQEQKIRSLKKLLEERKENDASVYVDKIREIENKARKCYAEPSSGINPDDFFKVLLFDGVFIFQMIRRYLGGPDYLYDIVGCCNSALRLALRRDMLLVENQLPFFVIWELFCIVYGNADEDVFKEALYKMLCRSVPGKACSRNELNSRTLNFKHLLEFTYLRCYHPSTEMQGHETNQRKFKDWATELQEAGREGNSIFDIGKERSRNELNSRTLNFKRLLEFMRHCCYHPSTSAMQVRETKQRKFIRCATELQEAGIKFESREGNSIFDIIFENETLKIPNIRMADHTEAFLRNVIAFEQLFIAYGDFKHAIDYMVFLNNLINSPKDVEILCQHGIIENRLGDDKAVATMINSLGAFVAFNSGRFYYREMFNKVNAHCRKRWNRWKANLKHNYFNSPWAFISVLAAVMLLQLAMLQTLFSVLTYHAK